MCRVTSNYFGYSTHSHSFQLSTTISWTNGYPPVTSIDHTEKEKTTIRDTGKLTANIIVHRGVFAITLEPPY